MKKFLVLILLMLTIGAVERATSQANLEAVWQKKMFPLDISFAKFSADGQWIYLAIEHNIHKMSAETGDIVSVFDNTGADSTGHYYQMEISKIGNYIITIPAGGSVAVWDTQNEKLHKYLRFAKNFDDFDSTGLDGARHAVIAPDESYLVIVDSEKLDIKGNYNFTLVIYDFHQEKEITSIPLGSENWINQISISNDGKHLLTSSLESSWQGTITELLLWDTETWQPIAKLEEWEDFINYRRLGFSDNDNFIEAVNLNYYTAKIFDKNTGEVLFASGKDCSNLKVLPDSKHFLALFYISPNNYSTLEIWNLLEKRQIKSTEFPNSVLIETYRSEDDVKVFCGGDVNTATMLRGTTTSIPEKEIEYFNIIVNPEHIIIDYNSIDSPVATIKIFDFLGNLVMDLTNMQTSNNRIQIPNSLASGTYFCILATSNTNYSQKFQVVR